MIYKVVLHTSEEGVSVNCPGLPGCWSQGATEAEALENIRDAIRVYRAAIDGMFAGDNVRHVEIQPAPHSRTADWSRAGQPRAGA